MNISEYRKNIFHISEDYDFEKLAIAAFQFHAKKNPIYKEFLTYLNTDINSVNSINKIPFLPVEIFKSRKIIIDKLSTDIVFTSSGTGGIQSKHYVHDTSIYIESFTNCFNHFYGKAEEYTILALLPSYLEREGSSLIYMAEKLIKQSKDKDSGFFLHNHDELLKILKQKEQENKKTLLLGVSYALLDLAEKTDFPLKNTIIMETGGMKGKRKELTKEELHTTLQNGFQCKTIHSEYGMTELLSQAYSTCDAIYNCPPWMKVVITEVHDPFTECSANTTGTINIIDLANIYSCPFLATSDLGKKVGKNSFKIIGRKNYSDIRGCNLMVQ